MFVKTKDNKELENYKNFWSEYLPTDGYLIKKLKGIKTKEDRANFRQELIKWKKKYDKDHEEMKRVI